MKTIEIIKQLNNVKTRSAWSRGVLYYAYELIEDLEEVNNESDLLNGAKDWRSFSWGGSALCYDGAIAERLCNASELRITRNGQRRPNAREEWLDTQARALYQASCMILNIVNHH